MSFAHYLLAIKALIPVLAVICFLSAFLGRPWRKWKVANFRSLLPNLRDVHRWRKFSSDLVRELIFVAATYGAMVLFGNYGKSTYLYLVRVVGPHRTQFIIWLGICAVGLVAHYFKRMSQRWYGMVEVIIGVASAFSIAIGLAPDRISLAQWSSLVGCAYVIARGMNNVYDATTKSLMGTEDHKL